MLHQMYALLVLMLSFSPPATACMCVREKSPSVALERADVVVSGLIISRTDPPNRKVRLKDGTEVEAWGSADLARWDLVVHCVWKGQPGDTVSIYSPRGDSSCGIQFEIGTDYLVYGDYLEWRKYGRGTIATPPADSLIIRAHLCSRTAPVNKAEKDFEELPPPLWTAGQE